MPIGKDGAFDRRVHLLGLHWKTEHPHGISRMSDHMPERRAFPIRLSAAATMEMSPVMGAAGARVLRVSKTLQKPICATSWIAPISRGRTRSLRGYHA